MGSHGQKQDLTCCCYMDEFHESIELPAMTPMLSKVKFSSLQTFVIPPFQSRLVDMIEQLGIQVHESNKAER